MDVMACPASSRRYLLALLLVGGAACGPSTARAPGERAPLSADCERLDETRCLLPWPSNTYAVADPASPTGLRLALDFRSLPMRDNPASLNRHDGFSPVTPLAVGFPTRLAPGLEGQTVTRAVRLFHATRGREASGSEVPLRLHVVEDDTSDATLLLAYPMRPLEYDTDYVAVATDALQAASGEPLVAPRAVQVALGLASPADDSERALAGYHAPTRALLEARDVEASHLLRVWDFTTRSADSVARPLEGMRARALDAVDGGTLTVIISAATALPGGALAVSGRVGGLPSFVAADGGLLPLDAEGGPVVQGTHEAPFRVVLPPGAGDFPLAVFGHGTGGSVDDDAFDADLLDAGGGKLNLEFTGWTGATVAGTLLGFERILSGTERSTARLAQALADASALEAALSAQLGEALAAPTLAGLPNPAAGRRVDLARLTYVGASLGGTMGFTHGLTEPRLTASVLNVPGAGWSHFAFQSEMWAGLSDLFRASTPSAIDRALGPAMAQGNLDLVDGAAWSAQPGRPARVLLIQESIGDRVLPNLGTELVAAAAGAVQVGPVIVPVHGVAPSSGPVGQTALTQFRLPASVTDTGAIHAFFGKDTTAGVAAREQLRAFLRSAWSGAPRIELPPTCAANGARGCDFH